MAAGGARGTGPLEERLGEGYQIDERSSARFSGHDYQQVTASREGIAITAPGSKRAAAAIGRGFLGVAASVATLGIVNANADARRWFWSQRKCDTVSTDDFAHLGGAIGRGAVGVATLGIPAIFSSGFRNFVTRSRASATVLTESTARQRAAAAERRVRDAEKWGYDPSSRTSVCTFFNEQLKTGDAIIDENSGHALYFHNERGAFLFAEVDKKGEVIPETVKDMQVHRRKGNSYEPLKGAQLRQWGLSFAAVYDDMKENLPQELDKISGSDLEAYAAKTCSHALEKRREMEVEMWLLQIAYNQTLTDESRWGGKTVAQKQQAIDTYLHSHDLITQNQDTANKAAWPPATLTHVQEHIKAVAARRLGVEVDEGHPARAVVLFRKEIDGMTRRAFPAGALDLQTKLWVHQAALGRLEDDARGTTAAQKLIDVNQYLHDRQILLATEDLQLDGTVVCTAGTNPIDAKEKVDKHLKSVCKYALDMTRTPRSNDAAVTAAFAERMREVQCGARIAHFDKQRQKWALTLMAGRIPPDDFANPNVRHSTDEKIAAANAYLHEKGVLPRDAYLDGTARIDPTHRVGGPVAVRIIQHFSDVCAGNGRTVLAPDMSNIDTVIGEIDAQIAGPDVGEGYRGAMVQKAERLRMTSALWQLSLGLPLGALGYNGLPGARDLEAYAQREGILRADSQLANLYDPAAAAAPRVVAERAALDAHIERVIRTDLHIYDMDSHGRIEKAFTDEQRECDRLADPARSGDLDMHKALLRRNLRTCRPLAFTLDAGEGTMKAIFDLSVDPERGTFKHNPFSSRVGVDFKISKASKKTVQEVWTREKTDYKHKPYQTARSQRRRLREP
ncbi:MAG: hypothetical protein ACKVOH_04275 [Chlamydiales bacterium]